MAKSSKKISKINIELEGRKYSQPSEGALDLNYYVKAQMKDGTWNLAKIIDCRLNKNHDPKKKRTDFSYDYYVHYMDFDRRMDEWLPRARVELTRELLEDDNPNKKKKGDKAPIDKEHEGKKSYTVTLVYTQ